MKPKIAIFDLTDCEGCELEFLNLKEKISEILDRLEIINWRLISNKEKWKNIDYAFVEGTPIKPEEIKLLKKIRKNSKYVVALGACAATGGFPAMLGSKLAKPISNYIKIDFVIAGCPANPSEIERFLANILAKKTPQNKNYPVCLACKAKQNECLLLKNLTCMGPVTKAGCNAICPTYGFPCFGCLGPIKDANIKALKNKFKEIGLSDAEIKEWTAICWRNLKEFNDLSLR